MTTKADKYLLLSWRKLWIIVVSGFLAISIHNFFYAIFGFEEAVFFIYVVIVLPIYFLILVFYTLIKKIKDKSILNARFIIRVLFAIIVGELISCILIKISIVNSSTFWVLTIIFSFIAYYLIKFKY